MADKLTVENNTREEVALKLLIQIGRIEGKYDGYGAKRETADRKWLLDTYTECLEAVRGNRLVGQ